MSVPEHWLPSDATIGDYKYPPMIDIYDNLYTFFVQ